MELIANSIRTGNTKASLTFEQEKFDCWLIRMEAYDV